MGIEELEGRLEAGTDVWRTEVGTGSTEVTAEIVFSLTATPMAQLTAEVRESWWAWSSASTSVSSARRRQSEPSAMPGVIPERD
jgi:hypothetical protein